MRTTTPGNGPSTQTLPGSSPPPEPDPCIARILWLPFTRESSEAPDWSTSGPMIFGTQLPWPFKNTAAHRTGSYPSLPVRCNFFVV